jgi:hypothetical protein
MTVDEHAAALAQQFETALAEISATANAARASLDGEVAALQAQAQPVAAERPPLIPNVPVDEPPPYVPPPPTPSARALIPDTPLVEAPAAAFDDDAPLWQS